MDDFLGRLRKWDVEELTELLGRVLRTDVEIKSGQVSEETALETLVVDACQGRLGTGELVGRWIYEV